MLHWHKGVPGQTEGVARHQGEIRSKIFCGERNTVREKGRREGGCLKSAITWGVLHGFIFTLALWADKNHTSIHLSLTHFLPDMKGCSAAPSDEGIEVFSVTGQSNQPSFLAEPPPSSCHLAGLGPWCLISVAFIPPIQIGSFF